MGQYPRCHQWGKTELIQCLLKDMGVQETPEVIPDFLTIHLPPFYFIIFTLGQLFDSLTVPTIFILVPSLMCKLKEKKGEEKEEKHEAGWFLSAFAQCLA